MPQQEQISLRLCYKLQFQHSYHQNYEQTTFLLISKSFIEHKFQKHYMSVMQHILTGQLINFQGFFYSFTKNNLVIGCGWGSVYIIF